MLRRRTLIYAALVLASAIALPAVAGAGDRVEQPAFTLVERFESFELRRYAPRIEATVQVRANNAHDASNQGFRILAGFIFGNNEARDEIAMTAPVGRSRVGELWKISFTMPSEWSLDALPRPKDQRVVLSEVRGQSYAVLRFRGAPGEETLKTREAGLRSAASSRGFEPTAAASIYNRYDPPWVPPLLRRNELWVAVEGAQK